MHTLLVAGAGKIGSLIALLLSQSKYKIILADKDTAHLDHASDYVTPITLDVTRREQLDDAFQNFKFNSIISSLPYFYNKFIAQFARDYKLNYFDLTEDIAAASFVEKLAEGQKSAFLSRCGSAPGFINIIANHLMQGFDSLELVRMRVGCLPVCADNALQYALTWSTDGLINEYGNPCYGLVKGKKISLQPLQDLEEVVLDGVAYEAFNTSGGIGSLADTYENRVMTMNYKTLRYPGHRDKMYFLMQDLKLNEDRDTLKRILETALPTIQHDVLIFYVSVIGKKQNEQLLEENYVKKIYSDIISNKLYSAIQIATASSLCAVVDIVLHHLDRYHGFVLQEQLEFNEFINNHFAKPFC